MAGAQFSAIWDIVPSLEALRAEIQVPFPCASTRARPLSRAAGFAPVTMNPKYRLPRASLVIGVLILTTEL
jgi:hypothetical protein